MNADSKPHLMVVPNGRAPKQAQAALIHDKWVKGRSLTDHEVLWGANFYRTLADQLLQCGAHFALAYAQANNLAIALEDFKRNRGI